MKPLNTGICSLGATIAILAVPSAAAADYYIPPENSAATQYTEAFPTGGGQREPGAGPDRRSPDQVLGERNARKLAAHGPQGEAAAEVAAATAPAPPPEETTVERSSEGTKDGEPSPAGSGKPVEPHRQEPPRSEASAPSQAQPEGSSGVGEVASQALGTSTAGATGALLPLAILGTIAWSFVYLTRKRKSSAA